MRFPELRARRSIQSFKHRTELHTATRLREGRAPDSSHLGRTVRIPSFGATGAVRPQDRPADSTVIANLGHEEERGFPMWAGSRPELHYIARCNDFGYGCAVNSCRDTSSIQQRLEKDEFFGVSIATPSNRLEIQRGETAMLAA